MDRFSGPIGQKFYGDRNTKCRLCANSVYDLLKDGEKHYANSFCLKFKGKPQTTYEEDETFYCPEFKEKPCKIL